MERGVTIVSFTRVMAEALPAPAVAVGHCPDVRRGDEDGDANDAHAVHRLRTCRRAAALLCARAGGDSPVTVGERGGRIGSRSAARGEVGASSGQTAAMTSSQQPLRILNSETMIKVNCDFDEGQLNDN